MSPSVNVEKPVLSQAMQTELNKSEAVFNDNPELAVHKVPLKEGEGDRVKQEVRRKMHELEQVDIYSGDTEGISKAFSDIFDRADANRQASAELANYFTQRNFRGEQDKEGFKAVTGLAAALQKYDPSKFDLTEPEGFMRFIPMPGMAKRGLANYMRSFKEAQGQIEQLMDGVGSLVDDSERAKKELKIFSGKLAKLAGELRVQYETFNEISGCVNDYLADLKERDPMKAQMVESELVYRVTEARLDTMTSLLQAMNGSVLVSSLIKTQDMIKAGAQRASSSGRLILTINQTAAAAASEQTDARELLESVNQTIGGMTEGTARMVLDHTKKMKDLASAPIGQADKLTAAFQMGFQALDELKNVQQEVSTRMEANIASLETVYKDASKRLNAEAHAVGAFQQIVSESQKASKPPTPESSGTSRSRGPSM